METVTIRFPSQPRLLRVIRSATSAFAATMGFGARDVDGICRAVDEACANVMRHCYQGECDQPVELELAAADDRLVVTIRDYGTPFHPDQIPPRDPDVLRPGGLGLDLIEKMMDEVTYRPGAEAGTELRMTKQLTRA